MHNRWRQCGGQGCNRRMGQFLDPALMLLLEQSPAHGYTLLNRLGEFGLDFLAPTVVYRALREMESQGWVTSTWDSEETQGPPRRVYALTAAGREVLRCCTLQLQQARQVLEYILALHDDLIPKGHSTSALKLTREAPMKIVIPADGTDLDAATSPVFGRCQAFIFVDPETLDFTVLPNPALNAPGGAGVQATQAVLQREVQAIIAPSLGPNAFRVVEASGVPAYQLQGSTVREVVAAFQAGKLPRLDTPGADHVGLGGGHRHRGH